MAYIGRGLVRLAIKEPDKAIADFNKALQLDAQDVEAYVGRANAWELKHEYDVALVNLNQALRLDSQHADAFVWRGIVWLHKRENANALADFTRAIDIDPGSYSAFANRASVQHNMKKYEASIADYNEAIRLNPKDAWAYWNRAEARLATNDVAAAFADSNEALRLDPGDAWAFSNRARVWRDMTEYDKALADFDQAIRLEPKEEYFPYPRSCLLFAIHREGTLAGVKTALGLADWRDELPIYVVILGHFAALREHQPDQAKAFLDEAAKRSDKSLWPYPVVKFLRGEIDEPTLLAAASDHDKLTEVRCFLGLAALQQGKVEDALAHFHWVKINGSPGLNQYAISLAELDRLDKEQAAGDGPLRP